MRKLSEDDGRCRSAMYYNRVFGGRAEVMRISVGHKNYHDTTAKSPGGVCLFYRVLQIRHRVVLQSAVEQVQFSLVIVTDAY